MSALVPETELTKWFINYLKMELSAECYGFICQKYGICVSGGVRYHYLSLRRLLDRGLFYELVKDIQHEYDITGNVTVCEEGL